MDKKRLLELAFMKGFPPQLRQAIADNSRVETYPAGSVVYAQGSNPNAVIYSLSGMLFSWVYENENEKILLNHLHPNRLIFVPFALQVRPIDFELFAATRVEVLVIPRHVFLYLLNHFQEFQIFVLNGMVQRLEDLHLALRTHKAGTKEQRIAQFLVHCCSWSDVPQQQLPFTTQFISECLSLSRPFVTKTLKTFAKSKVMGTKYGKTIVLDLSRLQQIAKFGVAALSEPDQKSSSNP